MSLEARVAELEENRVHCDQVLTGIEGTVALILKEQVELKKEVHNEIADVKSEVKALNTRFDQLELLIRQSLPKN